MSDLQSAPKMSGEKIPLTQKMYFITNGKPHYDRDLVWGGGVSVTNIGSLQRDLDIAETRSFGVF